MTEWQNTIDEINDILGMKYDDVLTTGDGDNGYVEFLDIMPHPSQEIAPELAIVNAARTSFAGDSKGKEKDIKLLLYLYRNKHMSPIEMVEFKFRVRAPLVVFWQWVRHRTWNMNFQSGRYVEFESTDFYVPEVWRKQSQSNKQGSDGVLSLAEQRVILEAMGSDAPDLTEEYRRVITDTFRRYQIMVDNGVAKEQARAFIPAFNVMYTAVLKTDARNLMHFLNLRMDEHAQWEIRQYANVLFSIFEVCLPNLANEMIENPY